MVGIWVGMFECLRAHVCVCVGVCGWMGVITGTERN